MEYENHIFYDVKHLSLKEKKKICVDAKKRCYDWRVDILDCNRSWRRQAVKMPFKEILKKLTNSCHFVIIHRRGYKNDIFNKWYLEIGFCELSGNPEHFLWIFCEESEIDYFIKKYNLKISSY